MKLRHLMRSGLAAAAALVLATTPAQPQNSNGHFACFPLSVLFFDDCTGEMIQGDGQVCIADTVRVDSSGGLHIDFQFRSDFTAVGLTTGQKYVEHDSANETVNISGTQPQFTETFTQNYHVNTSGGQNNLTLKELFHITVNANGEVTAFTDEFEFVCK